MRFRKPDGPQLHGPNTGVPTDLLDAVCPEFRSEAFSENEPEHDDVGDGNEEESPERGYADRLHFRRRDEVENDNDQHERDQQFTDVEPRVDEITDEPLLRSAVPRREKFLLTRGKTYPSSISLSLLLAPSLASSRGAVTRDEGALARLLFLAAGGGGMPLAPDPDVGVWLVVGGTRRAPR